MSSLNVLAMKDILSAAFVVKVEDIFSFTSGFTTTGIKSATAEQPVLEEPVSARNLSHCSRKSFLLHG